MFQIQTSRALLPAAFATRLFGRNGAIVPADCRSQFMARLENFGRFVRWGSLIFVLRAMSQFAEHHAAHVRTLRVGNLHHLVGDGEGRKADARIDQPQEDEQAGAKRMTQMDDALALEAQFERGLFDEKAFGNVPAGDFHAIVGM